MTIWALVFSTKFTVPGYCFVLRLVVPRTEWNTIPQPAWTECVFSIKVGAGLRETPVLLGALLVLIKM
jgi:hypothetical protein